MKGVKSRITFRQCGNCSCWTAENEGDKWGTCDKARNNGWVAIRTLGSTYEDGAIKIVFHREFCCKNYDYKVALAKKDMINGKI